MNQSIINTVIQVTGRVQVSVIIILAGLILSGCDKKIPPEPLIRPVLTQQIQLISNQNVSTYSGEIKARYEMALGFRINGKIIERFVEVGQVVEPGTLLAQLDPEDYQLKLMEAEGGLSAASAEKKKAASDLKRYAKLRKDKVVSATEYNDYSNTFNVANARYKQAQARLELAKNHTEYTQLYTDKGGVITSLDMETGQVIVTGKTVINLSLPKEKEVVIAVPENRLDELHHTDEIIITLWANQKSHYTGKIREISPSSDPVTRTYTVKISLLDADTTVQLGMTATVTLIQKKQDKIIRLPSSAIFQKNEQPAVWIYSPDTTTVHLQPVQVAEYQYDEVLINTGLKEGQIVVVAGVHKLHTDQKVRLLQGKSL